MHNSVRKKLSKRKMLNGISGFFSKYFHKFKTTLKLYLTSGSSSNVKKTKEAN
jgi:hypothetical protein